MSATGAPQLQEELAERLVRRARLLGWAEALIWALLTSLAVLVGWAWMDLLLDAPVALRLAGLGVAAVAGAAVAVWRIRMKAADWTPAALARRLDAAAQSHGQIVTGFDLACEVRTTAGSPEGLTQGLAGMATQRAAQLAAGASQAQAAPARGLQRSIGALAGMAAMVGLLALLVPGLVRSQWSRIVEPNADHPVYSSVQIKVQPGNVQVVYGGDLDIRASVSGGAVDRLETVLVSAAGAEEVVPMFAQADGQWRTSLAGLTAPGSYYVRARHVRSDRFDISVITVPRITSVTARITPPPYTQLPPTEGPIPADGLSVLARTTIELRARSNRPLSGGTMEVTVNGAVQNVPLTPAPGGAADEVRGTFTVQDAAKVSLVVKDTSGQASTDSFATAVHLLGDQRPLVRIVEPRAQSYATPEAKLQVEMMVEDDYGISSIAVYRSLNDSRPLGLPLPLAKNPVPRQRTATTLALGGLGLKPGDVVRLTGRAEDNDPGGVKGSESTPTVIQIISQADYNKMMLARAGLEVLLSKYQQAQRRMETEEANLRKMKEELSKLPPEAPLTESQRQGAGDLADAAERDANDVEDARALALPFDIDKAMTPRLDDVITRLRDIASQLRQGTPRAATTKDEIALLDSLIAGLAKEEKQFAGDVLEPLDYLAKIYPLIADQEKFVQLYQRERSLADRLAGMPDDSQDPKEKARMRDMQVEQKHIRLSLVALLEEIRNQAETIPDDPRIKEFRETAWNFSEAVRKSKAVDHMSDTELALAEFWGKSAQTQAAAAVAALKAFLGEGGNGMGQQGEGALKFQPMLNRNLGDSVAQLLKAGGLGGGGGYSTASGGSDVGLYGNMPMGLAKGPGAAAGTGLMAGGTVADEGMPGGGQIGGSNLAGSAGAAVPVPPQFRKRVDQYFQRVTDELQKE